MIHSVSYLYPYMCIYMEKNIIPFKACSLYTAEYSILPVPLIIVQILPRWWERFTSRNRIWIERCAHVIRRNWKLQVKAWVVNYLNYRTSLLFNENYGIKFSSCSQRTASEEDAMQKMQSSCLFRTALRINRINLFSRLVDVNYTWILFVRWNNIL